jgi:hypothetical protein
MNPGENQSGPGYSLWQLVRYMTKLGAIGFGGPVALVGYMYRDLVESLRREGGRVGLQGGDWRSRSSCRARSPRSSPSISDTCIYSIRCSSSPEWPSSCPLL